MVACVERSRGSVDVAVVVAVKYPETVSPATTSLAVGVVEPIPTLPFASIPKNTEPPSPNSTRRFVVNHSEDRAARRVPDELPKIIEFCERPALEPLNTMWFESTREPLPASEPTGAVPSEVIPEFTCNAASGFAVPTPTFPEADTMNDVAVLEPTTNAFCPAPALIARRANGDVVENPTFPVN